MAVLLVGCLLATAVTDALSSAVLSPFGKSQGDRLAEATEQPVVVRFPSPLRFQCRDYSVAVVRVRAIRLTTTCFTKASMCLIVLGRSVWCGGSG